MGTDHHARHAMHGVRSRVEDRVEDLKGMQEGAWLVRCHGCTGYKVGRSISYKGGRSISYKGVRSIRYTCGK